MHKKLELRTVVLLDNKSTMDLFCDQDLVEDIKKVKGPLRIQSNGGEIHATRKQRYLDTKKGCGSEEGLSPT